MKSEYDLANMKSRPNPFAEQLNQQVTLPLRIDVINFFEKKSKRKRNFLSGINWFVSSGFCYEQPKTFFLAIAIFLWESDQTIFSLDDRAFLDGDNRSTVIPFIEKE